MYSGFLRELWLIVHILSYRQSIAKAAAVFLATASCSFNWEALGENDPEVTSILSGGSSGCLCTRQKD